MCRDGHLSRKWHSCLTDTRVDSVYIAIRWAAVFCDCARVYSSSGGGGGGGRGCCCCCLRSVAQGARHALRYAEGSQCQRKLVDYYRRTRARKYGALQRCNQRTLALYSAAVTMPPHSVRVNPQHAHSLLPCHSQPFFSHESSSWMFSRSALLISMFVFVILQIFSGCIPPGYVPGTCIEIKHVKNWTLQIIIDPKSHLSDIW